MNFNFYGVKSITAKKKKYSEIYADYDKLLKDYNICNIHKDENGVLVCNGIQNLDDSGKLCCAECNHLGKKGCKVKSLSCKIWICEEAIDLFCNTHTKEEIVYFFGTREWLHQELRIHGIHPSCRTSKKDTFSKDKELKTYYG